MRIRAGLVMLVVAVGACRSPSTTRVRATVVAMVAPAAVPAVVAPAPSPPSAPDTPVDDGTRVVVATGHQDDIVEIVATPDGKSIVTRARDRLVRVFQAGDLREIARLASDGEEVFGVAIADDGARVAVHYRTGVSIYDVATGGEVARLPTKFGASCIAFVGADVVFWDAGLVRWHAAGGAIDRLSTGVVCLNLGRLGPTTFAIDDGRRLVIGELGTTWTEKPGPELQSFAIAFAPGLAAWRTDAGTFVWHLGDAAGKRVGPASDAVGFLDGGAALFYRVDDEHATRLELATGKTHEFHAFEYVVGLVRGSAVAAANQHLCLVHASDGGGATCVRSATNAIRTLLATRDGELVVAADSSPMRSWTLGYPTDLHQYTFTGWGLDRGVAALSPDQKHLASPKDDAIAVWSVADDQRHELRAGPAKGYLGGVAWSPDGQWLASTRGDTLVRLRADGSATEIVEHVLAKPAGPSSWYRSHPAPEVLQDFGRNRLVAYRPDGAIVAITDGDRVVLVRGASASGALSASAVPVTALAFRPRTRELAVGFADGHVRTWDTDAPSTSPRDRAVATAAVSALAFDATGAELAIATEDGKLHRVDPGVATGDKQVIALHRPTVLALAYLPHDRLASGHADGVVRILRLATGDVGAELAALPFSAKRRSDWVVIGDGRFESSLAGDGSLVYGVRAGRVVPYAQIADAHRGTAVLERALLDPADRPVRGAPGPDVIVQTWDRVVESLAVTPDGRELIGSSERGVFAFDIASGLMRRRLGAGRGRIAASASELFVGTETGIEARDRVTGARLAFASQSFGKLGGRTPAGEVVAADYNEVIVYAESPFARSRSVAEQDIHEVVTSPDGKTIGVVHEDGSIRLRATATLAELHTLSCESPAHVAVAAGATWVACATPRGGIELIRGDGTGAVVVRPNPFKDSTIYGLAFHPTRPLLAVATLDGVYVVDPTQPAAKPLRLDSDETRHDAVVWLPGGATLASTELGGAIAVSDATTGKRLRTIDPASVGAITTIARAEPGVLAFGEGKHLRTWSAATGHEHPFDDAATAWIYAWTVDGAAHVVRAYRDNKEGLVVTDAKGRATRLEVTDIIAVEISPDGTRVFVLRGSFQQPKELVAYDVATQKLAWTVTLTGDVQGLIRGRVTGELAAISSDPNKSTIRLVSAEGRLLASHDLPTLVREVAQLDADHWLLTTYPTLSRWDARTDTLIPTTLPARSLAVSPDGKHLVTTSENEVHVVDLATLDDLAVATTPTETNQRSVFLTDALIATLQNDSSVVLWTLGTGKLVRVGRLVAAPDRGTVLIAPAGYYMAEPEAARAIGFAVGGDVYRFEQFDRALNRPHLALAALGVATRPTLALYEQAYLRRQARFPAPVESGDRLRVPSVDVGAALPLHVAADSIKIELRADAHGRTLARVGIRVNGIPAMGRDGLDVSGRHLATLALAQDVPLEVGENRIELEAQNDQGVVALGRTLVVTRDGARKPGTLYVVAVGVSTYKEGHDLQYAAKDAEDVARVIAKAAGKELAVVPIVLRDQQVTRKAVLELHQRLAATQREDTVVMFVSGHGLLDPDDDQYVFGTYDVSFDAPRANGIRFAELEGVLDGIPARRRVLLLDTCHAGELDPEELAFVEQSERAGRKGVRRVAIAPIKAKPGVDPRARALAARSLFTDLRGTGVTVLASSAGAEYSYEDAGIKNGLFTNALIDGLDKGQADRDRDGAVHVTELLAYLATTVASRSDGFQIPQARSLNRELDFDLTPGRPHTMPWTYNECGSIGAQFSCGSLIAASDTSTLTAGMTPAAALDKVAAELAKQLGTMTVRWSDHHGLVGIAHARKFVLPPSKPGGLDRGVGWIAADPKTQRTALCVALDAVPAAVARCTRVLPLLLLASPPTTLPE